MNEPHVNFASEVYTSINIRKVKFIAYINIHFNQNVHEKSDFSAKIEAGKHLHAVFLLTAEQRQRTHDVQSDFCNKFSTFLL